MKRTKYLNRATLMILVFALASVTLCAQEAKKEDTITIKTSAVCSMCKERIENKMSFEKGVKAVNLDLKTKELTITYRPEKTTPEKLLTAVTKIGYDADDMPADIKAHNKLPECCKKGNESH